MLRRLVEKYQTLKRNYLNRSPRGKWLFVRDAGIFLHRLVGVDILDPNFKLWWLSYLPAFIYVDMFIAFIYTFCKYIRDDPFEAILSAPMYAGVVIPSAIVYCLIINPSTLKVYQSLASFAGAKIYTDIDEHSSLTYIRVCDRCAVRLLKSTSFTLGIIGATMAAIMGFPMYDLVFKKKIQLAMPVLLPFTDVESTIGLIANMLHQIITGIIGVPSLFGVEIITCMLKNTMWACKVAIGHAVDEFSKSLEEKSFEFPRAQDLKFRNILIQVQDFDRFISELYKLYYWKFFLQPIMLSFCIPVSAFLFMFDIWTPGLGTAFLTYSQLYILCDIGNDTTSAKQQLLLKFHVMPWYLMSCENQLIYAYMLNRLQNGAVLRIGPFAELNFETFSDMTKRIYSVLTMLIRFMK